MRTIVTLLAWVALTHAGELHEAARACQADRMRELLSQRRSLNATDENGMTPLHVAVESRQRECVWLLLKAGADRTALDGQRRTAFDVAEQMANPADRSVFIYMLRNFSLEGSRQRLEPKPWSLEHSVMRRQTNVTAMLLAMGADPNTPGTGGTAPLADAALKGDTDGVRLLLAHGAKPNAVSKAGTQPIHDAALGDSAEVIRELVDHGAQVNARTRDENQTPLHMAAAMGKMKAIEALLELGADLTSKDSSGSSPLEAAERAGLTDVVAFLRRAGTGKLR